ncbi:MAG: hypothetical protein WDN75_08095 [Bacteroidota bacterium]
MQSALGKNDVAVEMVRYRYFDHTFTDSIIYVALLSKEKRPPESSRVAGRPPYGNTLL